MKRYRVTATFRDGDSIINTQEFVKGNSREDAIRRFTEWWDAEEADRHGVSDLKLDKLSAVPDPVLPDDPEWTYEDESPVMVNGQAGLIVTAQPTPIGAPRHEIQRPDDARYAGWRIRKIDSKELIAAWMLPPDVTEFLWNNELMWVDSDPIDPSHHRVSDRIHFGDRSRRMTVVHTDGQSETFETEI